MLVITCEPYSITGNCQTIKLREQLVRRILLPIYGDIYVEPQRSDKLADKTEN